MRFRFGLHPSPKIFCVASHLGCLFCNSLVRQNSDAIDDFNDAHTHTSLEPFSPLCQSTNYLENVVQSGCLLRYLHPQPRRRRRQPPVAPRRRQKYPLNERIDGKQRLDGDGRASQRQRPNAQLLPTRARQNQCHSGRLTKRESVSVKTALRNRRGRRRRCSSVTKSR